MKTYLTFELISVDAIFDQVNAVNETLTSDFETLHNDMDAMELKHEQAIGKYLHICSNKKSICFNNCSDLMYLTCSNVYEEAFVNSMSNYEMKINKYLLHIF